MSVTPHPDDRDPTVMMPARAVGVTPDAETREAPPAAARPRRRRRPALSGAAVIVLVAALAGAVVAAGAFFLLHGRTPLAAPPQRAQEVAAPPVTPPASRPAPPPAASTPDKPFSPRQMLNEIHEGRARGHSVTASVDRGKVRIRSSRPGHVYVLAAGANKLDLAVLFIAVLFPGAADTSNRIQPGQTLELPDTQWPTNAEFLAIVSDEPRDFAALGPMAGKVICASPARCSESYGAAVFSIPAVSVESGPRGTARSPATPKTPPAPPTSAVARRCSDILERASLGEVLTADEYTFLRRDCR